MNVAIIGASGHGKVVQEILSHDKNVKLVGFIDDDEKKKGEKLNNLEIIGTTKDLDLLIRNKKVEAVALGIGNNKARAKIAAEMKKKGLKILKCIHPSATIAANAKLGDGTVICMGVRICTNVALGKNVIINTGATIDHDCIIEDNVHVSPGANLGGQVHVKEFTWVGIGSSVNHCTTIGAHSMIGGGSSVIKDIPDYVMAAGTPAVIKKQYDQDD